jgi:hypothetical protein
MLILRLNRLLYCVTTKLSSLARQLATAQLVQSGRMVVANQRQCLEVTSRSL